MSFLIINKTKKFNDDIQTRRKRLAGYTTKRLTEICLGNGIMSNFYLLSG